MMDPIPYAENIVLTGNLNNYRMVTGPTGYRLARRNNQLVLQGCMSWVSGTDGGQFWEDIPTVDLSDADTAEAE
jgi:hypothetical protein